jgi:hypothetical protein
MLNPAPTTIEEELQFPSVRFNVDTLLSHPIGHFSLSGMLLEQITSSLHHSLPFVPEKDNLILRHSTPHCRTDHFNLNGSLFFTTLY